MTKEEIALQLTLKSIERLVIYNDGATKSSTNINLSKDVADIYNYILENINAYK
nr:MAG TPA: hypothetical protein [Caudoviricetes sp.]